MATFGLKRVLCASRIASSRLLRPCSTSSADTFGTLSDPVAKIFGHEAPDFPDDPLDLEDERRDRKISDTLRPRPGHFVKKIEQLIKQRKLQEALRVLDVEMKEEYVHPNMTHFRLLIHACGQVGHTKKAFHLYKQYLDRKLDFNWGIYADLFNACANSPYPEFALERARHLRYKIHQKNLLPPPVVLQTAMKAFGRCGDLQTVLELVDQMQHSRLPITEETLNHILIGCISDKDAGFRHAILMWRTMMKRKGLRIGTEGYNLMLRAVRDCGIGDKSFSEDLLLSCLKPKALLEYNKRRRSLSAPKQVEEKYNDVPEEIPEKKDEANPSEDVPWYKMNLSLVPQSEITALEARKQRVTRPPNLLARNPNLDSVVALNMNINTPQDRLQLCGGMIGFLEQMRKSRVKPDIKTFSLLLTSIGEDEESEQELLSQMEKFKVVPDTDFFNQLIHRRAWRKEFDLARETLVLINKYGLQVDIVTYEKLAKCVVCRKDYEEFVQTLDDNGVRMNQEIFGVLLGRVMWWRCWPNEVRNVLSLGKKHGVRPRKKELREVEEYFQMFRKIIIAFERAGWKREGMRKGESRGKRLEAIVLREREEEFKNWEAFVQYYEEQWLPYIELDAEEHPWKQFMTEKDDEKAYVEVTK